MKTFTVRETGIASHPIIVTWSDYELDFSVHESLEDALSFIRMNPDIKSLRDPETLAEIFREEVK